MRVFTAAFATESNTFSPIPIDMESFESFLYASPGEHPDEPTFFSSPVAVTRSRAKHEDWILIEGTSACALPAGIVNRAVYEHIRDTILSEIHDALPLNVVILGLHGAMVAQGYEDCEGDFLTRIRALVGPDCVIGAELDPHGILTPIMTEMADILVCFKEVPHTDFVERAEEVVSLCIRAAKKQIKPRMSVYDCRMLEIFPTTREPMRSFVDKITALEGHNGILSISVIHGFFLVDVPSPGAKMLVMTDDREDYGLSLANELGDELFDMRGKTQDPFLTPDEAITEALETSGGPVVLSDNADNPGGGAPGDSTHILRRLLDRDVSNVAIGPIWDPQAVKFCIASGEGAKIMLRFAGKVSPLSGMPVDEEVEVTKVVRNATQSFEGSKMPLGDSVAIHFRGIDTVLVSTRAQAHDPDLFSNMGIDPTTKKIIVVKSYIHFLAAFAPIAAKVLRVDAGLPMYLDCRKTPYTRITRPIWPLDENPHSSRDAAAD
jgi:microcystin degradation protein MlrC